MPTIRLALAVRRRPGRHGHESSAAAAGALSLSLRLSRAVAAALLPTACRLSLRVPRVTVPGPLQASDLTQARTRHTTEAKFQVLDEAPGKRSS